MSIIIEFLIEILMFGWIKSFKQIVYIIVGILCLAGVYFVYSKITETNVNDIIEAKKQLKTIKCKSTILSYTLKPEEYKLVDGFVEFRVLKIKQEVQPKRCEVLN